MGLCASSGTRSANDLNGGNGDKYEIEQESKSSESFSNVTEKKIETALAAAKARRLVVSDVGGFERDSSFVCPNYNLNDNQKKFLKLSLEKNFFMYKDLENSSKTDMIGAMQMRSIKNKEQLMKQGDSGEHMFVIESGEFNIVLDGKVLSKKCKKGDVVGELALIYQAPRAASVVCTAGGVVWALDRSVFRNLIARVAAAKADSNSKLLANYPLFQGKRFHILLYYIYFIFFGFPPFFC
jgi:cAMP-dependent protein kinase regulator